MNSDLNHGQQEKLKAALEGKPRPEMHRAEEAFSLSLAMAAVLSAHGKGRRATPPSPPPREKTRAELLTEYEKELAGQKLPRPVRRQLMHDFRKALIKRGVA